MRCGMTIMTGGSPGTGVSLVRPLQHIEEDNDFLQGFRTEYNSMLMLTLILIGPPVIDILPCCKKSWIVRDVVY